MKCSPNTVTHDKIFSTYGFPTIDLFASTEIHECFVHGITRSCVDELGQSPCLSIYSIYINTKHLTTHDELEIAGDYASLFWQSRWLYPQLSYRCLLCQWKINVANHSPEVFRYTEWLIQTSSSRTKGIFREQ